MARTALGASQQMWTRIVDPKAAVISGVLAGLVFVALMMTLLPLAVGGTPWGPPRMIAAIVMGREVLPPPGMAATFSLGVFLVAVIVHLVLSVIYAFIGGLAFHRLRMGEAVAVGGLLGLALYAINFHGFTALFEWFLEARGGVAILAHAIFGMVAGWAYKRYQDTRSVPPDPRARPEA